MSNDSHSTYFKQRMEELTKANEQKRLAQLQQRYKTTPDYTNMSLRDELKTRLELQEMDELQKKYQNPIKSVYDFGQTVGTVAGNLSASMKDMQTANKIGYDNYAHRLGMCLNAQEGLGAAALSLGAGVLKEGYDIYCKALDNKTGNIGKNLGLCKNTQTSSLNEAWADSKKDMANNLEGIQYGLNTHNGSCRKWLSNLDYRNNQWRK